MVKRRGVVHLSDYVRIGRDTRGFVEGVPGTRVLVTFCAGCGALPTAVPGGGCRSSRAPGPLGTPMHPPPPHQARRARIPGAGREVCSPPALLFLTFYVDVIADSPWLEELGRGHRALPSAPSCRVLHDHGQSAPGCGRRCKPGGHLGSPAFPHVWLCVCRSLRCRLAVLTLSGGLAVSPHSERGRDVGGLPKSLPKDCSAPTEETVELLCRKWRE